MSTPNTQPNSTPGPAAGPAHRHRLADQIANQLLTARLLGGRVRFVQRHRAYLGKDLDLHDILIEAPVIAATNDPAQVRVAYMPSGALAVIRLHGPAWSLIMSAGQPVPDWVLAVHDDYPLPARPGLLQAFDLGADVLPAAELTRMCQRIHTAVAT